METKKDSFHGLIRKGHCETPRRKQIPFHNAMNFFVCVCFLFIKWGQIEEDEERVDTFTVATS